jgi:hypothetical protein
LLHADWRTNIAEIIGFFSTLKISSYFCAVFWWCQKIRQLKFFIETIKKTAMHTKTLPLVS